MEFAYSITVTVKRAGKKDNFGDPVPGPEGKDRQWQLEGCAVSWRNSLSIVEVTRIGTVTEVSLLAPATAELRAFDDVWLPDGSAWWVDGAPAAPMSPFSGWRPGLRASLKSASYKKPVQGGTMTQSFSGSEEPDGSEHIEDEGVVLSDPDDEDTESDGTESDEDTEDGSR